MEEEKTEKKVKERGLNRYIHDALDKQIVKTMEVIKDKYGLEVTYLEATRKLAEQIEKEAIVK